MFYIQKNAIVTKYRNELVAISLLFTNFLLNVGFWRIAVQNLSVLCIFPCAHPDDATTASRFDIRSRVSFDFHSILKCQTGQLTFVEDVQKGFSIFFSIRTVISHRDRRIQFAIWLLTMLADGKMRVCRNDRGPFFQSKLFTITQFYLSL